MYPLVLLIGVCSGMPGVIVKYHLPWLMYLSRRAVCGQVFARAGLSSPVVGSIVVGSVNIGGTLLAASLIDRAGRRTLLLTSHIAMAVCLAALAAANLLPGAHTVL